MEAMSLKEYLIQDTDYTGNYFLYAEGGMGKTTQLLDYNNYLLDRANNGSKTIPIYIDAKKFKKSNSPICDYVKFKYCKDAKDDDFLKMLYANRTFCADYEFLIIVDGINENTSDTLIAVMEDINDIIEKSSGKTRFIVSARNERKLNNFKSLKLKPLNETHITDYIKEKFNVRNLNDSLIKILQIPMFFRTFIETYKDKDSKLPDNYCDNKTIVRKADLLQAFLNHLEDSRDKYRVEISNNDIERFSIEYFLPSLAFYMAKNNIHTTTGSVLDDIYEKIIKPRKVKKPDLSDILCTVSDDLAFIREIDTDSFVFVHQYWRDYFAAQYIVNQIRAKKIDDLIYPIDYDIRRFVGEYLGECEFETKNDTDSSMSPIEEFMQDNNSQLNEKPIAIKNLIEIMKTSRNNCITANYSNLNLVLANFNDCYFRNSNFNNSVFNDSTFFNNGHNAMVSSIITIENNQFIISGDSDGVIKLWHIETGEIINQINIHSGIRALEYLNSNNMLVAISEYGLIFYFELKNDYSLEYTKDDSKGYVSLTKMSQDKNYLALVDEKNNLKIMKKLFRHYVCVKVINNTKKIKEISISPDNKHIACLIEDCCIKIWELTNAGKDIHLIKKFIIRKKISNIFFKNNTTIIYETDNDGYFEYLFESDYSPIELDITPNHPLLFSYNNNTNNLALYYLLENKLEIKEHLNNTKTIHIKNCIDRDDFCSCLNHSDNGKFMLLGTGQQYKIYIYDIEDPCYPYKVFDGKNLNVTSYCENKDYFYFGTLKGSIYKADKANGRIMNFYNFSFLSAIEKIAISSNGKYLAFSSCCYPDDYLFVIDTESNKESNNILCEFKIKSSLNEIAFSDDCNVVAVKYVLNNEKDFFDISSLIGSNNINMVESVHSAYENIDEMKNFRYYNRQIYHDKIHGFYKEIDGQIIWENRDLVNECLIDCDFQNAEYIRTNKSEFYKKLYLNGAIVPPEFQ